MSILDNTASYNAVSEIKSESPISWNGESFNDSMSEDPIQQIGIKHTYRSLWYHCKVLKYQRSKMMYLHKILIHYELSEYKDSEHHNQLKKQFKNIHLSMDYEIDLIRNSIYELCSEHMGYSFNSDL